MPPVDLAELKKFSVTQNFFMQVVKPLKDSGKVTNDDGLLELLKKVHVGLWQSSGYPNGFSGALAGYIQEILDGYKNAVKKGQMVQFGSISKVGGDTVVMKQGKIKTTQFKVTASGVDEIEKHITKAAWQLTGAGGETPATGSKRCIEVIVQDTETFATWDVPDWAKVVTDALNQGYDKQKPAKTGKELWAATDRVTIDTKSKRFKFKILNGAVGECVVTAINPAFGYVFGRTRFEAQWIWLTNTWWNANKAQYDIKLTAKVGVGSGTPKTPSKLPLWNGEK